VRYCDQTCIGKKWCSDGNKCKNIQPVPYTYGGKKYSMRLGGIPSRLPIQESGHLILENEHFSECTIMNILHDSEKYILSTKEYHDLKTK
jgi:hypothetical protein